MPKLLPGGSGLNYKLESVQSIIVNATQIALTVAGGVAAIYLIIGAIQYFTAYGDEAKATAAKNTILYAIIGVIVIVLAKVIISWVWTFVSPTTPTFPTI